MNKQLRFIDKKNPEILMNKKRKKKHKNKIRNRSFFDLEKHSVLLLFLP